jgi:hypothetical protein
LSEFVKALERVVGALESPGLGEGYRVNRRMLFATLGAMTLAAVRAMPAAPEDTTPDGLVRVPSRRSGGVFREPGWPFTQYRRLIVEPVVVSFIKDWEKNHAKEVSNKEIRRIRDETSRLFREEFKRELIERGKYTFADEAAPDVLIVAPTITDLDIPAPEADNMDKDSFAPRSVALRITGELRDATTGRLIGRVDTFAGGDFYGLGQLRPVNRGTNAQEIRSGIRQWTALFREALNVAKNERRPQ